jgi:hypothetical protein
MEPEKKPMEVKKTLASRCGKFTPRIGGARESKNLEEFTTSMG